MISRARLVGKMRIVTRVRGAATAAAFQPPPPTQAEHQPSSSRLSLHQQPQQRPPSARNWALPSNAPAQGRWAPAAAPPNRYGTPTNRARPSNIATSSNAGPSTQRPPNALPVNNKWAPQAPSQSWNNGNRSNEQRLDRHLQSEGYRTSSPSRLSSGNTDRRLPQRSGTDRLAQSGTRNATSRWAKPQQSAPGQETKLDRNGFAPPLGRDVRSNGSSQARPTDHGAQPNQASVGPARLSSSQFSAPPVFGGGDVEETRSRPRSHERDRKTRVLLRGSDDTQVPDTAPQVMPSYRPRKAKLLKPVQVDVFIPTTCAVSTLARLLGVRLPVLQRVMTKAGMANESAPDYILTAEYASLLAAEFDRNPIVNDEAAFDVHPPSQPTDAERQSAAWAPRPPVVTIMGHVDHGKTTLLDTLRNASIAKGEAGGITQHIGAFSVSTSALSTAKNADAGGVKSITFLDTPGHAAFSAMRARGANVTDVVVLVVAADDGVMPQTKEVIELVKRDERVQLVVALNKVDKPGADLDKVMKELLVEGVHLEEFGGDIPSVRVSGLTGEGLPSLIETIAAIAEMSDLRSPRAGPVHAHVLESHVQRGLGAVGTVLVARGCLTTGSHVICGTTTAKVRAMSDSSGKAVKVAYPGDAVTVAGWKELPAAGDEVLGCTEADGKRAVGNRLRAAEQARALVDVEAINAARRAERDAREEEEKLAATNVGPYVSHGHARKAPEEEDGGRKMLRLIIKGDVSGSVEAVAGAVEGIGNNLAGVKIVHQGVGNITESDLQLAQSSQGVIVAFNVNVPRSVEQAAGAAGVPITSSGIIYQLMDAVTARVIDLLPKIKETRVLGEASVLQMFDIHLKQKQVMRVAGCRVVNGLVEKEKTARVVRAGEVIFTGPLDTLRHLKKDVSEIRKGSECGLSITGFTDFREGDLVQVIQEVEKPGQL